MGNTEKRMERDFFTTDGLTLARKLLGKLLVHETPYGKVRAVITETEAYMGVEDKGSHTYGGKRTDRTEPMFHIGGTSYVYLIYGMYSCMNIAANVTDVPQAVLIRMVSPADEASEQIMLRLRLERQEAKSRAKAARKAAEEGGNTACEGAAGGETVCGAATREETARGEAARTAAQLKRLRKNLANGPGRLCVAMHITKDDNDLDMVESDSFYVTEGIVVEPQDIQKGKRINIDYAEEAADYLWRFTISY